MIKQGLSLGALALAAISSVALAQVDRQEPPARRPQMGLALEAAQAALTACAANGVKAAASVVDADAVLRLLLAADGTGDNQVEISRKKAVTAVALKVPTSEVADRMSKDQVYRTQIEADKSLFPRPGALPFMVGNELIGAIGVSGASGLNGVAGGVRDEACAKAGRDKVSDRLK